LLSSRFDPGEQRFPNAIRGDVARARPRSAGTAPGIKCPGSALFGRVCRHSHDAPRPVPNLNGRSDSEMRRRPVSHGIICLGDEVVRLGDVIVLVKPVDAIGRHAIPRILTFSEDKYSWSGAWVGRPSRLPRGTPWGDGGRKPSAGVRGCRISRQGSMPPPRHTDRQHHHRQRDNPCLHLAPAARDHLVGGAGGVGTVMMVPGGRTIC
jgi:hypothetical protein